MYATHKHCKEKYGACELTGNQEESPLCLVGIPSLTTLLFFLKSHIFFKIQSHGVGVATVIQVLPGVLASRSGVDLSPSFSSDSCFWRMHALGGSSASHWCPATHGEAQIERPVSGFSLAQPVLLWAFWGLGEQTREWKFLSLSLT